MSRRDRLLREALRSRFVVTTGDGHSFDGLLEDVDDRVVILVNAWAVDQTGRTEVDGRLFVPRDDIAYMQAVKS